VCSIPGRWTEAAPPRAPSWLAWPAARRTRTVQRCADGLLARWPCDPRSHRKQVVDPAAPASRLTSALARERRQAVAAALAQTLRHGGSPSPGPVCVVASAPALLSACSPLAHLVHLWPTSRHPVNRCVPACFHRQAWCRCGPAAAAQTDVLTHCYLRRHRTSANGGGPEAQLSLGALSLRRVLLAPAG